MKKTIIGVVIIIVAVAAYFLLKSPTKVVEVRNVETKTETVATTTPEVVVDKTKTVLGKSVEGRDIMAYHFGEGQKEIIFMAGLHGGYSWNTSLLAYELVDYLKANASTVPADLKVTVIPVLNPDGLVKVTGTAEKFAVSDVSKSTATLAAGRFNSNEVDLNRNFDCDWKAVGKWQSRDVSGGTAPFSEPESAALKNYVESKNPAAVVVWYSAAGGVFASNCYGGVSAETSALTDLYAKASGYKAYLDFDYYEITGDVVNWFAKKGVPAVSVLLTNHTDTEWSKNLAGIKAVLSKYSE